MLILIIFQVGVLMRLYANAIRQNTEGLRWLCLEERSPKDQDDSVHLRVFHHVPGLHVCGACARRIVPRPSAGARRTGPCAT